MATKAELELREILLTSGLVLPVTVKQKGSRLNALCRLAPGQEGQWLKAVNAILVAADTAVTINLGTQFLLKDGVMVKGWFVTIDGRNVSEVKTCLDLIRGGLQGIEPVLEAPAPAPRAAAQPMALRQRYPRGYVSEGAVDHDPEVERARIATHTSAAPRAPEYVGPDPLPPPGAAPPRVTTIFTGRARDQKNRQVPVVVQEYPLPHVFEADMNAPDEKGKGVKTL